MFDKSYELKLRKGIEWSCEGIRIQSKFSGRNDLKINLWPKYPENNDIELFVTFSTSSEDKRLRIVDLVGGGFTYNKGKGYGTLIVNTLIQLLQNLVKDQKDWSVSGFVSNGQDELNEDNEARCGFWRQFGFTINSTNGMSCYLNKLKLVDKDVDGKASAIINTNDFYDVTKSPPLLDKDMKKLGKIKLDVLSCKGIPNDESLKKAKNKERNSWRLISILRNTIVFFFAIYIFPQEITLKKVVSFIILICLVGWFLWLAIFMLWRSLSLKMNKPLLLRAKEMLDDKKRESYENRKNYIEKLEGEYGFVWRLQPLLIERGLSEEQNDIFLRSKNRHFNDNKDYEAYATLMKVLFEVQKSRDSSVN